MLPAVQRNTNIPDAIETPSVVGVNAVLKGAISGDERKVVISQTGGSLHGVEVSVPADPLFQSGERYILFLIPDNRKNITGEAGSPRYSVVGVWAGKARIVNQKVVFLPRAVERLQEYHPMNVDAFAKLLDDKLHNRIIPARKMRSPIRGRELYEESSGTKAQWTRG